MVFTHKRLSLFYVGRFLNGVPQILLCKIVKDYHSLFIIGPYKTFQGKVIHCLHFW